MAENDVRCSVIIPTFNRAGLLRHTLDSLTRQTLPARQFEVLVVDDGSADGTAELVRGYADRLPVHYDFQPDEGWRAAAARNVGLRRARGDVSVFLDSGVQAHPGFLAAHLESHDRAEGPVAVIGYVFAFAMDDRDAEVINAEVDVDDVAATVARWTARGRFLDHREKFYARYGEEIADLPAPWVVYWTPNASASTEQVRRVGLFDEAYRSWGGEDLDLAYRLHRDGARFVVNRAASAVHLPHPKDKAANEASAARNYRYFADKYGTPITQIPASFPVIDPYDLNDVIVERGLPSCEEYLAGRR